MPDKKFIIVLLAVASGLCLLQIGWRFGLLSLIAGIIFLITLFTYGKESSQTKRERIVFCMIGATDGIIASGFLLPLFSNFLPSFRIVLPIHYNFFIGDSNTWLIIFWLIAFWICWRLTTPITADTEAIIARAKQKTSSPQIEEHHT